MTGLKERVKTLPVWEGDYWRDRYDSRTKGYANEHGHSCCVSGKKASFKFIIC